MNTVRSTFAAIFLAAVTGILPFTASAQTTQTTAETAEVVLSPLQQAIKSELKTQISSTPSKFAKKRIAAISDYYEQNGFSSLWLKDNQVSDRAAAIVRSIERAEEHALYPADYAVTALQQAPDPADTSALAAYEIRLARSLVAFAQHLNAGRVSPKTVTRENVIYPEAIAAEKILQDATSTSNVVAYLRLLAPHTPRYERLRLALASYRSLAQQGGWEQIAEGEVLKPGMEDDRVPALRKRLAVTGDYIGDTTNPSIVYDGDIVDAVMAFQKRHGLEIDGVIGRNTLKEINMTIEERIAMMEYNLERRRWMQDDYGRYYVFANLADQVLKVVKDEKTLHAELIQVGLPYHRTPVFTDEMEYIEINPYWNVPKSIAVNELLPKLRQNANALSSQNFEVLRGGKVIPAYGVPWGNYSKVNFPVRLRQKPGTKNALGRIKFMFPNNFNVYIHDTPSKSKFDKASRFFSHGCLRLKDPLKMAEVLLGEQGWNRAKIDATVASKKRKVVKLEKKIPVHIAYMTAWVNKDGSVHFRRDVYGRDKILGKALKKVQS
ncbi:MAG: L,D-transpeptidase family protein [Pseudomonadota bacterium]